MVGALENVHGYCLEDNLEMLLASFQRKGWGHFLFSPLGHMAVPMTTQAMDFACFENFSKFSSDVEKRGKRDNLFF